MDAYIENIFIIITELADKLQSQQEIMKKRYDNEISVNNSFENENNTIKKLREQLHEREQKNQQLLLKISELCKL